MATTLEPTPESVTSLLLATFTDIHQMTSDLQEAEQATDSTRLDIGVAVATMYKHRRMADVASRKDIARKGAHLLHKESLAEVIRLGLEHYLSVEVEEVDSQLSQALHERTIEATVHAGMDHLQPFDRRNGIHGEPRNEDKEVVRGKFLGVNSAEGRVELEHPIEGVVYGIKVVQLHRGLVRPIVDLAFPESPKLAVVRHNSRSHTYV